MVSMDYLEAINIWNIGFDFRKHLP
uniref:Uncharacterized protein n=1 Tax=Tetranychus urticae TaxID=32264 RepID=T1KKJ3_TETUR